ncbi:AAA family ATPase [Skermania sp. ID1734]|uniref:BTAD domain-containing putative transcriptional regulator n=1 Tax=Skermania sp. ID1734 TaxID=2597516 RepID=UPI00118121EA|nr:BTAD domain-containing putative transcriptional regulator [Skermania sp. ID1734]TSD95124.1 AAA family ATPase [Skermania sp. ID1734]
MDIRQRIVVSLLGEVATRRDGELAPLPGIRARSLLVALATDPGRSRTAQGLIDEVWADQPPRAPMNALHTQVSRLRTALPDGTLEMGPTGYRLALDRQQVDLTLATELVRRARQEHVDGRYHDCLATIAAARELWRGDPGADLGSGDQARALAQAADTVRAALDELAVAAQVAAGNLDTALPIARAIADRDPLDESAHATLMRILASLGRPNEALEVFAAIRGNLAEQLGTDPGRALVDLNTEILRGGDTPKPAAPRAIGLRAAPNPLLGRDGDLAALDKQLCNSRVTTILGPGGTGKTRVANELGTRWADRLPVALVELASVRSGEDVVAAISSTLGLSEIELKPGARIGRVQDARERLRDALAGRSWLLILDNCEHVVDDVADAVADLVAACDQLTVLTTSRAPLRISAEAVYPLAPLPIDESGSAATDLFRARALAVRPGARLDASEVARLCRTLDGLPLAIELAAARMRSMSVEEINAKLGHRFALLRTGDRSSPARHRTLHAVIEWSWNLLEPPQQTVLRRLCRFPAGFTLSAAEAVADAGDIVDVADALDGLVNQSLLSVLDSPDGSGVRYHMLETVREFGEEQLTAADEGALARHRMATWAREFTYTAMVEFRTPAQVAVVHRVGVEHDNLVAVLRSAIGHDDAGTVYQVFAALGFLWALRGAHSEVMNWAPRILAVDPNGSDIPGDAMVAANLLAGLHLLIAGDLHAFALARTRTRPLLRNRRDISETARLNAELMCARLDGRGVARLLAAAVRSPDPASRATAFTIRAQVRENTGDIHGSLADARAALELANQLHDTWGASALCQHLGSLYGQSARYAESIAHYQLALDALKLLQAHDEVLQVQAFLSASLAGAGQLAAARRELAGVLTPAAAGSSGAEFGMRQAGAVASLAEIELLEGDTAAGLSHYRQSLAMVGWPKIGVEPNPLDVMLAVGTIDSFVLAGRAGEITEVTQQLACHVVRRFGQFRDLPQLGCVAVALGSHGIATGSDGVDLLAAASRVHPRQDYPSMQLDRHLDAARATLGDDEVDAALQRAAGLARRRAAEAILDELKSRT